MRIQSLAVANVIPSCMKFTSNARQYQPFVLGNSRPGKILSRAMNMTVARTTNMLGRVRAGSVISASDAQDITIDDCTRDPDLLLLLMQLTASPAHSLHPERFRII